MEIVVCDIRNDEGLRFRKDKDIIPCITEHIHKDGGVSTVVLLWKSMNTKVVGMLNIQGRHESSLRVHDPNYISPCINTMGGGGREPKIMEWLSQKGVNYVLDSKRGMCTDVNANVAQPLTAKGQSDWTGSFVSPDIEKVERTTEIGSEEPTKITLKNGEQITSEDKDKLKKIRIRKLTPREVTRLMGFTDEDYEAMASVNSSSQIYRQCGNSIVVNCLEALFKQMI